jgi:hypothetical protein
MPDTNLKNWLESQPDVALTSDANKHWAVVPGKTFNLRFEFDADSPAWESSIDAAILAYYDAMHPGEREHCENLINLLVQAMVERKESFSIYWDQGSELSQKQVARILAGEQDEVSEEILDMNREELWRQRNEKAKELVDSLNLEGDSEHPLYETLGSHAEEALNESIYDDANLKDLMRNTSAWGYTVRPKDVETSMEGWRGIRYLDEVEDICTLLSVSPHHLQRLVGDDTLRLPVIPERDGQECVTPEGLMDIFVNSIHGGQVVFLVSLDLGEWANIENRDARGLRVKAGTTVCIHDYCNGATGGETDLIRDIILPAGSYTLDYDLNKKYGIQACCALTPSAWAGEIEILPQDNTDDQDH